MSIASFKAAFQYYVRAFLRRADYVALCMILSVGGAAIYAFLLADEIYLAGNEIYITQAPSSSGETAESSPLTRRLAVAVDLVTSEPNLRELVTQFWALGREFPGQSDIQRDSLSGLRAQLDGNPDDAALAEAAQEAQENVKRIEERERLLSRLDAALEADPLDWEAGRERKRILRERRREERRLQQTVQSLMRDIQVSLGETKIEVTCRSSSPELAIAVTDEIVEQIVMRFFELHTREASLAQSIYEDRFRNSAAEMKAAIGALEAYAIKYPSEYFLPLQLLSDAEVPSEPSEAFPGDSEGTPRTHEAIRQELAQVDAAISETSKRIKQLKDQLEDTAETVVSEVIAELPPEVKKAREQMARLQLELAELLADGTEEHPLVKRTRRKIYLIDAYLKALAPSITVSETTVPNPLREETLKDLRRGEVELPALIARQEELREHSEAYEEKLKEIPKRVLELEELRAGYRHSREKLATSRARLEEAHTKRQLVLEEAANALHVQGTARLHYKPVWPDKRLFIVLGVAVGLFLSCVTVFSMERARRSIRDLGDARRYLDSPILATIPEFRTGTAGRRGAGRKYRRMIWLGAWFGVVVLAGLVLVSKIRDLPTGSGAALEQPHSSPMPEQVASGEQSPPPSATVRPTIITVEESATPSPLPPPDVKPSGYITIPQPEPAGKTPQGSPATDSAAIPDVNLSNYIIIQKSAGAAG